MSLIMAIFTIVYVIGIPLGSLAVLRCNKHLLSIPDDSSSELRKSPKSLPAFMVR